MRFYKKNKILIIVVAILFILSLNFFQKPVKNFFYLASSPVQKFFCRIGENISKFSEKIRKIEELKEESEELKLRNQELLAEIVSLKELKTENKILRQALGLGLQKEFKLALAEVIGKEILEDSILINKGKKDGIAKDMPVITCQKFLIGKISEVYKDFSRVMLISSKEACFDVQIYQKDIKGVVKGKGSLNFFLDLIPQDKEISNEDIVITSAFGGVFPKNLLVGKIKRIKISDIEPFQQAEISPFFDIKELESVFIITNH